MLQFAVNHLEGTFTSATALSGTYTTDAVTFKCNHNVTFKMDVFTGTWTGIASMQ
jgi:hypothetical protein